MQTKFIFTVILACTAGLLFGYDTGIIAGALPFIQRDFELNTWQSQFLVGSALFGALIGTFSCGLMANNMGRREMIKLTAALFTVGSFGCAMASNYWWLLSSRFIVGGAIGLASYSIPLYISEISPPRYRGGLIAVNTIAVTAGIVIAYLTNYALSFFETWRWMLGLGLFPAVFLWLGIYYLPESPRWLVHIGCLEKARLVLTQLRTSPEEVKMEFETINKHLQQPLLTWHELLQPQFKNQFIIGIVLAALQQMTGINAILYYAPILLGKIGFVDLSSSLLLTIVIGMANLIMTVVAIYKIDTMGRRPLLLWGIGIMILCLVTLGGVLKLAPYQSWSSWVAVFCIISFVSAYAVSIGCIFWIVIAEIYPLNIRSTAMSIASGFNWSFNLLVAITFLELVEFWGVSETFWLFAFIGMCGWLFCLYRLPETARYSLEEIESW